MDKRSTSIIHSTGSSSLADVLERILDKGVVIAGDITVKIVDIELLTIQVRLLVCSVDKAREIGMSWWTSGSFVGAPAPNEMTALNERMRNLELILARLAPEPGNAA